MSLRDKKHAFTLAEIMIVMLILTILFAAFAPFITKRRVVTNRSKYAVWSYKDTTNTLDAFYDPGSQDYTGTLFFGTTPDSKADVISTYLPISRVVIRSGPVTSESKLQRQIQFRYGRTGATNSDEQRFGKFAGSWLMDGKNVLLGGEYKKLADPENIEARYNVGIGYNALNNITNAANNAALGFYALSNNNSGNDNVAIGVYAGGNQTAGKYNTFVGYNAGAKNTSSYNTYIGYEAGKGGTGASGSKNTFVGAFAGKNIQSGSQNLAIGTNALSSLTTGSYNVAIGYNALKSLTTGGYNVAIGYNACSNITTASFKTCIGANSGPKSTSTADKYLKVTSSADTKQRTYIGSAPKAEYGGDAVLEIHNVGGTNTKLINSPGIKSNTTTVINGNLLVRGRAYFTHGSELLHFDERDPGTSNSDHLYAYDKHYKLVCASDQRTYSLTKGKCIQVFGLSFCSGCVKFDSTTTSDRRLKNIGLKNTAGLKEINKLKIYNYTFKNDKTKTPQIGVIAQELQEIFPNSVFTGKDGYLRIQWDEMFYAAINAIKELDKKIIAITKRATKVETQISKLEKENVTLKGEVEKLTARIEKLKANN